MKFTCQNAKIIKYQIYAYQEDISVKPDKSLWKKLSDIGVVNGLREHNSCSFKKVRVYIYYLYICIFNIIFLS